ncbi:MAG: GspE/PulE family protein [Myxococcota bacterium]|nr:GspE/PulE family protein [Myxococcota bacterium]
MKFKKMSNRGLVSFSIHPPSAQKLSRSFCTKRGVLILNNLLESYTDPAIIGVRNADTELLVTLENWLRREIEFVLLNDYDLKKGIEIAFDNKNPLSDSVSLHLPDAPAQEDADDPVSILNYMLLHALKLNASDIHIECYDGDVDVRLRIDGILHQVFSQVSPQNISGVISRLKILCELDIAERQYPQDGRFRMSWTKGDTTSTLDFRVNTCPTLHGENAVIRLLGSQDGMMAFDQLGMDTIEEKALLSMLKNPEGMFFVAGPTGSGKTTTLYAALNLLNDGTKKIITAEDPIEYELDGITQSQVNINLSFARLARSFLRMDPDVMLIGEVRDPETAEAIVRAASTGHLALSTIHATDAFSTLIRLQSLGIDKNTIANIMLGALSQRLLRRICPHCKVETTPTKRQQELLGSLMPSKIFKGKGCQYCHDSGYKGRIGVYEVFMIDHHVQDMLSEEVSLSKIRRYAHKLGFHSLLHDAIDKVKREITSIDEVFRVLPLRYIMEICSGLDTTSDQGTPSSL